MSLTLNLLDCGLFTNYPIFDWSQVFSCGKYMDGQLGRCPSDFSKDSVRSDNSLTSKVSLNALGMYFEFPNNHYPYNQEHVELVD